MALKNKRLEFIIEAFKGTGDGGSGDNIADAICKLDEQLITSPKVFAFLRERRMDKFKRLAVSELDNMHDRMTNLLEGLETAGRYRLDDQQNKELSRLSDWFGVEYHNTKAQKVDTEIVTARIENLIGINREIKSVLEDRNIKYFDSSGLDYWLASSSKKKPSGLQMHVHFIQKNMCYLE